MESDQVPPAFSWPTRLEDRPPVLPVAWNEITPDWAWGGSSGAGVRVCVVDSGIEADHPALDGMARGGIVVERLDERPVVREERHGDLVGHGTACAGIIHSLAPEAELYSARVLGASLKGGGDALIAGIRWAIDSGMNVINLSLSTRKEQHILALHDLADEAYFRNTVLVASANNTPVPSYPWLFSSVVSVASHAEHDPFTFYYNPRPPAEFTAPGVNLDLIWSGGGRVTSTGNSFATSHVSGIVALILGKHPRLTPFQVKTVLYYTAKNVRDVLQREESAGA